MEIEIMKEVLEKQGISGKQLEEIIEKTQLEQEKRREEELKNEEKLKTVEETVKILEKALDTKWNGPKVRRFITSKDLKPMDPNPPKKVGFRIHIEEIERFIEWESMSKEDWKKRSLEAEEQLQTARKTIEQMKLENEKLQADLKEAKAKLKATGTKKTQTNNRQQQKEETNEKTDTKNEQDKKGV